MKKLLFLFALACSGARAVTLDVSDFSNFSVGFYSDSGVGSWSDSTAEAGATAFTIGDFGAGAPGGFVGNGFIQWLGDTPQDWSAFSHVALAGFAPAANATPFLNFYIEDVNTNSSITQFDLTSFTSGLTSLSTMLTPGAVDLTQVAFWGFTVDEFDNPNFSFTFDHVSLSDSAGATVPDAASSALLLAVTFVGLATLRRWQHG